MKVQIIADASTRDVLCIFVGKGSQHDFKGSADLIHEALRWYLSLPVLRKRLAGAAAIPGGEPSGHPLASLAGRSASR